MGVMAFGAVQNITITADNAYAYNASNRLACDSGSKILVQYSYRADGKTLKESLLDFIDVTPPAEGQPEPWVSIRVAGDGFKNDVDFTDQPYLWLGSPEKDNPVTLDGTFEPCGDVYRLGYGENASGERRGLVVGGMCDNPVTGAPRMVLVRGAGNVPMGGGTFSGGIVVEGPAYLSIGSAANVGTGYKKGTAPAITLRNVNGQRARLNLKNANVTYPEDMRIHFEGENDLHSCGATKTVCTVIAGPVTGSGTIRLTDQGGVRFTSASNTFDGAITVANTQQTYDVEVGFGDGEHCSWAGSVVTQPSYTNHYVSVNCDGDFTLDTDLGTVGGRLEKRGRGVLTLGKAFGRKAFTGRPDVPVMRILGGTVKRTVQEPAAASGRIEIRFGATLDLNGVPATSLWLPYGGGDIVNPANGAVLLRGAAGVEDVFWGTIEGRVSVEETSGLPWRLGAQAHVGAPFVPSVGSVLVDEGFTCQGVELKNAATLLFGAHGNADAGGLRMEVWFNNGNWSADGHMACLAVAVARADGETPPDVVTDMTAFGDVFKSGENSDAGGTKGPFSDILGGSKNNFVAKFTGYFTAETTGRYDFRIYADDGARLVLDGTNTVINQCLGTGATALNGSATLEAGRHPITVYFCEESGWEVFQVQMKAPGESDFTFLPTRLLSTWSGRATSLGAVTGEGSLALAEPGAVWPTMDLSDFSGRLVANTPAASSEAGRVDPCASYLHFPGGEGFTGPLWWYSGRTAVVSYNGREAVDLCGAANANGFMNRTRPLDLSKPFTISFDFSIHAPWPSENSLGDGFALMLHDKVDGTFGSTFGYDCSVNRINNAGAYGMQCYLMPAVSHFAWVKNNRHLGNVATNSVYVMKQAKDRTKPFHATLAWDLEKLVFTLAQDGKSALEMTSATAAADLAEKFPSGQAYLGIWGRNAGYYCAMLFENLKVEEETVAGEPETVTFGGVLGVTNGVAQVLSAAGVRPVVASAFEVTGAGGLATPADVPVQLTGTDWSFALSNTTARLTLEGPFTLPEAPIEVSLIGEPTAKGRVLADLTGVTGGAPAATFRLAPDCPKSWQLSYSEGLLKVSTCTGTIIYFK